MKKVIFLVLALSVAVSSGCVRNRPSEKPPIHLNQNMDDQPRYRPQEASKFFADGSAMRLPVEGTIARGQLHEDTPYYTGRDSRGELVKKSPVPVDMALLVRGRERFNINCSPCHGRTGNGQGIVVKKGMLPPPSFDDPRLVNIEDGHLFDVISNGIRNMPPYKYQVSVSDRWAVIAYLRALQMSHNVSPDEVPPAIR